MRKISLNGTWHLSGGGYACDGTVPGSVYSFLLDNRLMEDPFYRTNELDALKIMENDFTFSRTFDFTRPEAGVPVFLHCDGLDTLCDLSLNGHPVASTDNMHRTYEFDVTSLLVSGENTIEATFHSANKYMKEKQKQEPLPETGDPLNGYAHLRKALCMSGWDWGPRLPDAGIWRDISLVIADSDRLAEVHITQHHENGRVLPKSGFRLLPRTEVPLNCPPTRKAKLTIPCSGGPMVWVTPTCTPSGWSCWKMARLWTTGRCGSVCEP